jgi:fucose 4-O-acetylase-like acetyltransferase
MLLALTAALVIHLKQVRLPITTTYKFTKRLKTSTLKTNNNMRTLWVDYTKAIGIMLVVYGHVTRGLYIAKIQMNESLYKLIDSVIYNFHMPLFFFLSGLFFVSSLRKRGLKGLIANKIDSIFYLYIVWSVLQGGIALAFNQLANHNISPQDIISVFWEPTAQFWFLYSLFFVTLIATLVYAKLDQKYALFIFVAASFIVIFNMPSYGITPLIFALPYLCFFMLGIYFNQIERFFNAHKYKLLLPLALLFIGAQWAMLSKLNLVPNQWLSTTKLATTLISILFTVNICMCLANNKLVAKHATLLSFIGTSSMIIYLAHVLTGSGTRIILQHFFGVTNLYVHLVLGCLMGVFGSILLSKMLSKMGCSFLFAIPDKLSFERNYAKLLKIKN